MFLEPDPAAYMWNTNLTLAWGLCMQLMLISAAAARCKSQLLCGHGPLLF